jgi:poly(glycerol-phosphate) alpha-glucosyltransferase
MNSIIQVTSWLSGAGGGIPPVIRALTVEFRQHQLDCVIAGLADPTGAPPLFPKDWPVLAGRISGPASFGYSPDLARQLRPKFQNNPLVHVHGLWMYPGWLARKLAAATGRPRIVSPHGMLDAWALRHSRWKKNLAAKVFENHNLRTAACLHALCEPEAKAFRALGMKNPIAIIPNGVDLPEAGSQKPETGNPASSPQKTLLYLGRIHPKKGLVNLLKAWTVANRKSADWILAIAGWDQGGHEKELRRLSAECGIQDSIVFLGPKFGDDKAACYRNCDAFILPSVSEGLPMVVLEAWSHAKPVLMTPECNLPDGFAANAAIRIEPGVEGIARGLQDLFGAPHSALRTLGDNGRNLVAGRFAWPKIAVEMKSVYEWMLGGGPKPDCVFLSK